MKKDHPTPHIYSNSISNAWAQNIITGKVISTDQESELLIGVNISCSKHSHGSWNRNRLRWALRIRMFPMACT